MTDRHTEHHEPERVWAARVSSWCLGHPRWLVGIWVLVALAGFATLGVTSSRLTPTFDLPGQPAFEANQKIVGTFGSGGDNPPLVLVTTLPRGATVEAARPQLRALVERLAAAAAGARIVSAVQTAPALVSADGRTTFALVYPVVARGADPYRVARPAVAAVAASARIHGSPVSLTGQTILATGGSNSGGNSILVETLLAGLAALVVLAFVFGSLLALLPLLIAVFAIPTTFLGILGFTTIASMSSIDENLVGLIGLGIGIDYALLVVTRWREELSLGHEGREAVLRAVATAGESVVFSGTTVMISLAALVLTPVPFLRSFGIAGALIALTSIAVTLTALPVILDRVGGRLEWPHRRSLSPTSRAWDAIAGLVVGRKWIAAGGGLAVIVVLALPVFGIHLGEPSARSVATTAPTAARSGVTQLAESGLGVGILRPVEVLAPAGADLGARLAQVPGASTVVTSGVVAGQRVTDVWSVADSASSAAKGFRAGIRQALAGRPGVAVGGAAAQDDNEISSLYGGRSVLVVLAIVIATFLLLARALGSFWLPIKALALNVVSLAAAYGVLTFIWQDGHGTHALFGSPATGSITIWVPLAVFALLFGLSMDYEVFILTRIKEEHDRGRSTPEAIVESISRTGRLVTSGALILFFAFVALGGVPVTDVKVLSTGLAVGIILDATIIRGVLAPALVALLGRANWWSPRWLDGLLHPRRTLR